MPNEERPMKTVHDCATGESVTMPVTDEEWAQMKKDAEEWAAKQAAEEAAAAERAALKESAIAKLVAGQPLTEAEAALLVP